jgi:hypothetical protein
MTNAGDAHGDLSYAPSWVVPYPRPGSELQQEQATLRTMPWSPQLPLAADSLDPPPSPHAQKMLDQVMLPNP